MAYWINGKHDATKGIESYRSHWINPIKDVSWHMEFRDCKDPWLPPSPQATHVLHAVVSNEVKCPTCPGSSVGTGHPQLLRQQTQEYRTLTYRTLGLRISSRLRQDRAGDIKTGGNNENNLRLYCLNIGNIGTGDSEIAMKDQFKIPNHDGSEHRACTITRP